MSFPVLLAIIVVLMTAFIFLLQRFVVWYTSKCIAAFVDKRHHDAEQIIESGTAPRDWERRIPLRWIGRTRPGKTCVIWKLKRLIHHIERSALVTDGYSRDLVVERLRRIQAEWTKRPWEELFPATTKGNTGANMP